MTNEALIQQTAEYVKDIFSGEGTGHDWWHMYRVWQLSKTIASQEKDANMLVVELGALLHDIADWKFNDDEDAGPKAASAWLKSLGVENKTIEQVAYIVKHISFKGGLNTHVMQSLEGKIVQDADRLDAIGAVGIARTFAFGGSRGRALYDPAIQSQEFTSIAEYKQNIANGTTVNHFYDKLLLLKDGMHTDTAKRIAQERHKYMEEFLDEFFAEWDGKK